MTMTEHTTHNQQQGSGPSNDKGSSELPSGNTSETSSSSHEEDILTGQHSVLDKGFVRLVDRMGDDAAIVQAARVSYGKGTKGKRQDAALIKYLMRNKHTSPFEMCEVKFHIKMPIFIARQWVRHRTASINEYSARYSIVKNECYIPQESSVATQAQDNKQGRGEPLSEQQAKDVIQLLTDDAQTSYDLYEALIGDKYSLSRELARTVLSVGYYTELYWKTNLHNLLNFLRLRLDAHAQYEIREYAKVIMKIARAWCPIAIDAFEEYTLNSMTLSRGQLQVLKAIIERQRMGEDALRSLAEQHTLSREETKQILEFCGQSAEVKGFGGEN